MSNENFYPQLRLELQGVKHQILHNFSNFQLKCAKKIQKEIDNVIKTFDFKEIVNHEIQTVLSAVVKEVIKEYFEFGYGRKFIKKCMDKSISQVLRMK